jgi:hypothetical protein
MLIAQHVKCGRNRLDSSVGSGKLAVAGEYRRTDTAGAAGCAVGVLATASAGSTDINGARRRRSIAGLPFRPGGHGPAVGDHKAGSLEDLRL